MFQERGVSNKWPSKVLLYIYNEQDEPLDVVVKGRKKTLRPGGGRMFAIKRDGGEVLVGEDVRLQANDKIFIDPVDPKNQVCGLGGEFLQKYGVPEKAEFAFTIKPPGEGERGYVGEPVPLESFSPRVRATLKNFMCITEEKCIE